MKSKYPIAKIRALEIVLKMGPWSMRLKLAATERAILAAGMAKNKAISTFAWLGRRIALTRTTANISQ